MAKSEAVPTLKLSRPPGAAPWESNAVRTLAERAHDKGLASMELRGPQGIALQAIGSPEDHEVAGRVVAEIQKRGNSNQNRAPRAQRGLTTSALEANREKAAEIQAREQLSFGAVYEHRDSCGKPRLIGSTNKMPERQFALDWKQHEEVRALGTNGRLRSELVWAGVGRGVVGEEEMSLVREAVVHTRSERLRIEKLSGIKPYSQHT
eukprot:gnl/MRDRNA2_/MRDRNA2_110065_c0_seq1.p1 gnl/MRDRNA2_/MRDRNA2_110065_c0~~gnl/MRDRNA2_/MRDRNA2_110065_c0_seq1.p1  ORF type:complete len:207 (+),score=38.35 gnl/MRDRNA2_/MRDRNA2_110065_c0_seq1:69-689(+)